MSEFDEMTMDQLKEELRKAQEENKNLKKNTKKEMTLKVSDKGAVQINGIRRFPITLYRSEMNIIFEKQEDIKEFIQTNKEALK